MSKQVHMAEEKHIEKAQVAYLTEVQSHATDTDKGSHHSHGSEGELHRAQLKKAERSLVRKLGKCCSSSHC